MWLGPDDVCMTIWAFEREFVGMLEKLYLALKRDDRVTVVPTVAHLRDKLSKALTFTQFTPMRGEVLSLLATALGDRDAPHPFRGFADIIKLGTFHDAAARALASTLEGSDVEFVRQTLREMKQGPPKTESKDAPTRQGTRILALGRPWLDEAAVVQAIRRTLATSPANLETALIAALAEL